MVKLCQKNRTPIVASPPRCHRHGHEDLEKAMPDRYIDVGIAGKNAVIFAAGMATMGFIPVVAIYSRFSSAPTIALSRCLLAWTCPSFSAWIAPDFPE